MSGGLESDNRNSIRDVEEAANEIYREYLSASGKFAAFNSAHEGWAVIREEVDELWDEVKKKKAKQSLLEMRKEARQIGAMALRFMIDICG